MTGGPPGWRSREHVPEVVEPVDKFEQEVCWPDGLRDRVSGQKACVHEFQTGPPKNKFHARASQKTTSTPTRSAQRARRLRDAVNDKPMRPPATEKVLAQRPNRLIGTSEEVPCGWTGASCAIRVPSAPWSPAKPRGQLEKNRRRKT